MFSSHAFDFESFIGTLATRRGLSACDAAGLICLSRLRRFSYRCFPSCRRDRTYSIYNTLFTFGEFLGWIEAIRREVTFLTGSAQAVRGLLRRARPGMRAGVFFPSVRTLKGDLGS